jgi:sporulation protein YabP
MSQNLQEKKEDMQMDDMNTKQRAHKLMLTNRRTCMVSGVSDVLSFDLAEILLETDQGMLMIKGSDLHVNRLTLEKGEVDVEGKIDSLTYSEVSGYGIKGESLLGKLFK